jgi:hypothetical protein
MAIGGMSSGRVDSNGRGVPMARFVFIKEICETSWLLWTVENRGSCLRDFRTDPPTQDRRFSIQDIEKFLKNEGNGRENAPRMSVTKVSFWKEQQRLRNIESGLEPPEVSDRLLNGFKKKVKEILARGDSKELRIEFDRWKKGFGKIVLKKQFNHWDNDDATFKRCYDKGIGWTATMLEQCRVGGKPTFITTGSDQLDFSLIAMELGLGISSKDNILQKGEIDFVKPDGLGVRRNSSFCVIEIKGPKDEGDLLEATLQGVCGALAVFSKRKMIVALARAAKGRRPKVRVAEIPTQRRTLGVFVLIATKHFKTKESLRLDGKLNDYCKMILQGFPQLKEIAYFSVGPEQCPKLNSLSFFECINEQ